MHRCASLHGAEVDEFVGFLLPMMPNVDHLCAVDFTCPTVAAMRNRVAVTRHLFPILGLRSILLLLMKIGWR